MSTISATPTSEKLNAVYVSNQPTDAALPTITIGSGSTPSRIITTTEITGATGGIGWFLANTTTPSLQGLPFHFRVADGIVYVLTKALPDAPVSGDQFTFVGIGSNRSSTDILAMLVGGVQPELKAVQCTNITGLTIHKASAGLGEGTLTVDYTPDPYSMGHVRIKMGTEGYGESVNLSAASGPAYVFNLAADGWIKITWDEMNLPLEPATDTFTLTYPKGTFIPDFEGYETNSTGGKVRYRCMALNNTDPLNSMIGLTAYPYCPVGSATTIATGESIGLDAGSFDVTDASDWAVTAGFWIRNKTANGGVGDCRYVESLSGNTLTCRKVDWVTLTGNGGTAAAIGSTLTGSSSKATAVVVASRAGQAICKSLDGTFTVGETAGAVGTLSDVKVGFRGYEATTWAAGDEIELIPDVDLALDTGSISVVTTETQIPAGLTHVTPSSASPLELGDLVSGGWLAVNFREWILEGMIPRANVIANTRFDWT